MIMLRRLRAVQGLSRGPARNFQGAVTLRKQSEAHLLNRTDRPAPMPGEADVKYLDGDFRVVRPGAFVRCAVTGVAIPLEELRYWSVDLQEAYATPEAVAQRQGPGYARK